MFTLFGSYELAKPSFVIAFANCTLMMQMDSLLRKDSIIFLIFVHVVSLAVFDCTVHF